MSYPNTLESLIVIANWLDDNGQYKMADAVDAAIAIIAAKSSPAFPNPRLGKAKPPPKARKVLKPKIPKIKGAKKPKTKAPKPPKPPGGQEVSSSTGFLYPVRDKL